MLTEKNAFFFSSSQVSLDKISEWISQSCGRTHALYKVMGKSVTFYWPLIGRVGVCSVQLLIFETHKGGEFNHESIDSKHEVILPPIITHSATTFFSC